MASCKIKPFKCLYCKNWEQPKKEQSISEKCTPCKQVSKKCKKGSGLYYQIALKQKEGGVYLSGDELAETTLSSNKECIVFDYHNVTDLFTPEEFVQLVKPFIDNYKIFILSYVGSTSKTRIEADEDIRKIMISLPKLQGFLCFRRGDTSQPGNKGGFIKSLKSKNTTFFDDSEDHISAGKDALASSFLVPVDKGNDESKDFIRDNLNNFHLKN